MKLSDFIGTSEPTNPFRSVSEKLHAFAKHGLDVLQTVEWTMQRAVSPPFRSATEAACRQIIANSSDDPDVQQRTLEDTLQPQLARSGASFAAQLFLAGYDWPARFSRDPANVHLVPTMVQTFHQMATWAKYGLNVFNLTHGLTAGLILTEPPPLVEDNFKLPFPVFAVTIPSGTVPFWYGDQQRWADTIWVHQFLAVGACAPGRPKIVGDVYQITVESEGATLFRREPLAGLEQRATEVQLFNFEDDPTLTPNDDVTLATAIRLVRNLVAWIHSTGLREYQKADAVASRRDRPRRNRDPSMPTTWVLGREVKLAPEIRQMAVEVAMGQRHRPAGWKVRMRHIVRGHWKMQFHGEGRALRKRIWVEPYWRIQDSEAAFQHIYAASETNDDA